MYNQARYILFVAQNNVTEIGLTRLPDSGDQCPDIIQYECITSGRGSDTVALDFQEQFRASHAEYIDGVEDQRLLGGDLIIGNLSRSTGMDCVDPQTNMRDYCYTFIMTVQLTDQTLCRVITCTIAFLDGSNTDVGNATITRCNGKYSKFRSSNCEKINNMHQCTDSIP